MQLLCVGMVLAALCSGVSATGNDTTRIPVLRNGRKIMLDGFLMEWSRKNASAWGRDTSSRFDVQATPEGIAGYLSTAASRPYPSAVIRFETSSGLKVEVNVPPDSGWRSDNIRIDDSRPDSVTSNITMEWLFPWKSSGKTAQEPLTVTVSDLVNHDGTHPVLEFIFREEKKKSGERSGLLGRILLIGGLGAMYLMVQMKIRNQSRQKESPHQSA